MRRRAESRGRRGLFCAAAVAALAVFAGAVIWNVRRAETERLAALSAVPEYVFTYAEVQPEDYPTVQGAQYFADRVAEETQGRIQIRIFANSELGDEVSVLNQLQYGGIDFARSSVMTMGDIIPEMNVLQLPYLFRSREHMWKVLDGEIGEEFMQMADQSGIVGLSWYDAGARHFYNSEHPIERLEDMRGLRIRVSDSSVMEAAVKALGAKAVHVPYSEVYAALETGEIDGAENNLPSYESMKHYEVAGYVTLDAHVRAPELQMVSQATWNKLAVADQEVIVRCAKESALYERRLWDEREQQAERTLRDAGCEIISLSDQEQIRFRRAIMIVYQEFCSDYFDMINRISQVVE